MNEIIELFKTVNEPFYNQFIVPLESKTLTNVLGIFLHRPEGFEKDYLYDILFGVIDQLSKEQLDSFKDSVTGLISNSNNYVNKEGTTQPLNVTPLKGLKGLKNASGTILNTRLNYSDIQFLVTNQYKEFYKHQEAVARNRNESEAETMMNSLSRYVRTKDADEKVRLFIDQFKKSRDELVDSIYNVIADNQTPIDERKDFLKEILNFKKYDKDIYTYILEKLLQKPISEELKTELDGLKNRFEVLSKNPETEEEFVELVNVTEQIRKQSPPTPVLTKSEETIKKREKTIKSAKNLLAETHKMISEFKKTIQATSKFGKRRSYKKRKARLLTKSRRKKRISKKKNIATVK